MITVRVRLFAALRERAGHAEITITVPAGSRAGDVWPLLGLGEEPAGVQLAVNRAYASRGEPLADHDEVAFIPPVSGGGPEPFVLLTNDPIDVGVLVAHVAHPAAGAITTFQGTVRDNARDRDVLRLEYEVFAEMALAELRVIAAGVALRHNLLAIAVAHRAGRCEIGEATVAIACSAAHREAALTACQETIDTLKQRVPIWKKEFYADGAQWIGVGS